MTDAEESNPYAPAARAARGRALAQYARNSSPAAFEGTDPEQSAIAVATDGVHAALAEVPLEDLPAAIGRLLGTLAADVLVDRTVEAGKVVPDDEVEALIRRLSAGVRERHYGE